MKKAVTCT